MCRRICDFQRSDVRHTALHSRKSINCRAVRLTTRRSTFRPDMTSVWLNFSYSISSHNLARQVKPAPKCALGFWIICIRMYWNCLILYQSPLFYRWLLLLLRKIIDFLFLHFSISTAALVLLLPHTLQRTTSYCRVQQIKHIFGWFQWYNAQIK